MVSEGFSCFTTYFSSTPPDSPTKTNVKTRPLSSYKAHTGLNVAHQQLYIINRHLIRFVFNSLPGGQSNLIPVIKETIPPATY